MGSETSSTQTQVALFDYGWSDVESLVQHLAALEIEHVSNVLGIDLPRFNFNKS